ncbi:hypothetical protein J4731_01465 [Providencia rettgeri]|nr:hypothetical protein [Providencia rettgeri]
MTFNAHGVRLINHAFLNVTTRPAQKLNLSDKLTEEEELRLNFYRGTAVTITHGQ